MTSLSEHQLERFPQSLEATHFFRSTGLGKKEQHITTMTFENMQEKLTPTVRPTLAP
jgi:hypothetical protein